MNVNEASTERGNPLPPQISDPSIFRKAWDALHEVYLTDFSQALQNAPDPATVPIPDFVKLENEDKVNNNYIQSVEAYSREFPPEFLAPLESSNQQGQTLSRPMRQSCFGVNSIIDDSQLVGLHRSNQAESTVKEYQPLLDGVKSFYPFLSENRNTKLKQTAKYIRSNQQSIGGPVVNREQICSEQTLLFLPSNESRRKAQTSTPTSTRLSETYSSSSMSHFRQEDKAAGILGPVSAPSAQVPPEFVQENEKYLQEISDKMFLLNQQDPHELSQSQPLLIPETHTIKEGSVHRNCNQNNNVNINLTLALQQQNGDLYSAVPVVIKCSASQERSSKLIPQSVAISPRSRSRKTSTSMQIELLPPTPTISETEEPAVTPRPRNEAIQLKVDKAPIVIGSELGVTKLRREDLQNYSRAQEPQEPEEAASTESFEENLHSDWSKSAADLSKIALNYTGESMSRVLEVADDIVTNCVYLPDERKELVREALEKGEEKLSVAMMGLVGFPSPQRHEIYETAAENIEAIQDLSKETIGILGSVLNWLTCKGESDADTDAESTNEFLNKLRILASMSSEIDPDSQVWKEFEDEIGVYAETVSYAVGNGIEAAKSVSRKLISCPSSKAPEQSLGRCTSDTQATELLDPLTSNTAPEASSSILQQSLEIIEEQPEEVEPEDVQVPVIVVTTSVAVHGSANSESSRGSGTSRKDKLNETRAGQKSYLLQYKMRQEKNAEARSRSSPARNTKQERIPALAPPTVPMAPSSEDPSTISIQALHVHHDQDSSAMAQDSSQSLVAASSIIEVMPPNHPGVDGIIVTDPNLYTFGIASMIASAATSITDSLWNLQKTYLPNFLTSIAEVEGCTATSPASEIASTQCLPHQQQAPPTEPQAVNVGPASPSLPVVTASCRPRSCSLERSATTRRKIPKPAAPAVNNEAKVAAEEYVPCHLEEERSSTPVKPQIQVSGTSLAEKQSNMLLLTERRSNIHQLLDKIKPFCSRSLISVEVLEKVPGQGTSMCELDAEFMDEGNGHKTMKLPENFRTLDSNANVLTSCRHSPPVQKTEPERPRSARSRIPIPSSFGNTNTAAPISKPSSKESADTISLYRAKHVRISSDAIENPIATPAVPTNTRARSVPTKTESRFSRPVPARGSGSTTADVCNYRLSSRPIPNPSATRNVGGPLRAQHFLNQQPFEVIDIVPMQTGSMYQGSAVSSVPPKGSIALGGLKSKTSYKQIMDEKKIYLAKNGANRLPTYKYTATVSSARPAVHKSRTVQARPNSGAGSQVAAAARGSHSTCHGPGGGGSTSFITLN